LTAEELSKMKFLFIAGGLGTAPVYPQVKFLSSMGAVVDVIIGAKTKDMLIFEAEMKSVCNNLYICTDDGSYGKKGLVTNLMTEILDKERYDHLVAIGPMIMMKFVTLAAKPYNIPLTVSLNTLMVDGTGMCGACRVTVAGKTRFACVEGPEFNAYDVDFDEAMRRQGMYKSIEAEKDHICKIGLDHHNTPVK
jgi:NAD(P)H-flavin reductase